MIFLEFLQLWLHRTGHGERKSFRDLVLCVSGKNQFAVELEVQRKLQLLRVSTQLMPLRHAC